MIVAHSLNNKTNQSRWVGCLQPSLRCSCQCIYFSELKRIRLISYRRQNLGVSPGPFLTWRLEEIFVFTGYFDRLARRPGQSRSDRQQCLVPKKRMTDIMVKNFFLCSDISPGHLYWSFFQIIAP